MVAAMNINIPKWVDTVDIAMLTNSRIKFSNVLSLYCKWLRPYKELLLKISIQKIKSLRSEVTYFGFP